jgi:post-segregation antitoxin (ccd killing protein)
MKAKLTVTVDRDLLPRAKRFAREHGVSLSSLIEDALRGLTDDDTSSFVDRWRGTFVLADRDDERYRSLLDKYR